MSLCALSQLIHFKRQFLGFLRTEILFDSLLFSDHACYLAPAYADTYECGYGHTLYNVHLYSIYNWHKEKTLLHFLPLKILCVRFFCRYFSISFRFYFTVILPCFLYQYGVPFLHSIVFFSLDFRDMQPFTCLILIL